MCSGLALVSLSENAKADETRSQIEAQGNQQIQYYWNQYQQGLQERQQAWEQGHGDRFSNAYITADAKAGAMYQEWLRSQTRLGDELHNYDVSQWQKEQDQQQADQPSQQPQQTQPVTTTQSSQISSDQTQPVTTTQSSQISAEQPQTEVTKTDQPQTKASAVQFSQPANVEAKSTTHNPQQATTSRVRVKLDNLSSQVKKPAQSNTVQNDQQTKLPQTGNGNLLTVVGILLFAFLGILTGMWKFFDARRGGKR